MKLNMKRVALGLCMAACLFSLSACSKADTASSEIDVNIQAQLSQMASGYLSSYVNIPDDQLDEVRNQTAKQSEALAEGVDSWKNVKHDLGALISVEDTAEVEEIDSGYSATVHAVFEKREMDFGITTDREGAITSVSFVPEYTLGENMEQAAMNMVMGMGTVFIVLIFISFLISCFKYINRFEEKMKNKGKKEDPEPLAAAEPAPAAVVQAAEENLADDLELVAVITAAIAASTGTSPSGLVVRSIRRAPAGKWKKA